MAIEIERKYLGINDFEWLKARLLDIGASSSGFHFEKNIIFDKSDYSLFKKGKLLRLRTQVWKNSSCSILTLKLPEKTHDTVKVREEREVAIENSEEIKNIFIGLGYDICACYEKFRAHWVHEKFCLEMDILPFMKCVEIEANLDNIDLAEKLLGLEIYQKSTETYHDLHKEWRIKNNLPDQLSFIFSDTERDNLLNSLL